MNKAEGKRDESSYLVRIICTLWFNYSITYKNYVEQEQTGENIGKNMCLPTCLVKHQSQDFENLGSILQIVAKQNQVYEDLSPSTTEILYYDNKPVLLQIQKRYSAIVSDMCIHWFPDKTKYIELSSET